MSTGMLLLDAGLVVAVLAGILTWLLGRTSQSASQRKEEARLKSVARQPWANDRSGRGNR